MHNLRARRSIHQTAKTSETDNSQRQASKSRYVKTSAFHKGENYDIKETETDDSDETSEDFKTVKSIYPKLPKEDIREVNERKTKLNKQDLKEKYTKLQKESIQSPLTYYIMIIIIILVLAISLSYCCIVFATKNATSCETQLCLFQEQYKNLRETFINQDWLSWKIIMSAIISVVNATKHNQPAVILLVANRHSKVTLSCITNSLASSVALSFRNSLTYPKIQNIPSADSAEMKEIIYQTFEKSFEKENHHVIVLENLDTFSADSAMTLHFFCDHENAPYKNIVIILTAIVDELELSLDKELKPRDMDRIARNHLDQVWEHELQKEKRAALLSRIISSVAVIRTEENVPNVCHK